MKILKNIILALIILMVALAVIGLLLPRMSNVSRSTVIQAPAEVIFTQVNDLKKNEAWSPWKDPTMKLTYGPVTEGKGAVSSWVSKGMGSGTMTIEESVPYSAINIGLDFGGMGKSKALWTFVPESDGIKVTEVMVNDAGNNPVRRWMNLMSEKWIGPYFEKGLAALKQVSETRAAEVEKEKAAAQLAAAAAAVADSTKAAEAAAAAKPAPAHKKAH
ncbi:MAG: hypothetical protein JWO30_1277 [Fibrobacteres bacterium]|nr:hypothetical protein [Fibrobacterota bacterium]